MKRDLVIGLGLVGLVVTGVVWTSLSQEVIEYTSDRVESEVVTQEVRVSDLEARIEEALAEAMPDIDAKAQEAAKQVRDMEIKKIEDAVRIEYIREIEQSISSESY